MMYAGYSDLPDCCKKCGNRDYDSKDEYSPTYNYCVLNLILPTAKNECKKFTESKLIVNG